VQKTPKNKFDNWIFVKIFYCKTSKLVQRTKCEEDGGRREEARRARRGGGRGGGARGARKPQPEC